jgi:hypothetical protein
MHRSLVIGNQRPRLRRVVLANLRHGVASHHMVRVTVDPMVGVTLDVRTMSSVDLFVCVTPHGVVRCAVDVDVALASYMHERIAVHMASCIATHVVPFVAAHMGVAVVANLRAHVTTDVREAIVEHPLRKIALRAKVQLFGTRRVVKRKLVVAFCTNRV